MDLYEQYAAVAYPCCKQCEQDFRSIVGDLAVRLCLIRLREHDQLTFEHCMRVHALAVCIGIQLSLNSADLCLLGKISLLHDVGKVKIDTKILNKKGYLNTEEYSEIKQHAVYGYNIASVLNLEQEVLQGVYSHHERIDGSGYPQGIADRDVTRFGRIVAIADVFDAITSERPYKEAVKKKKQYRF